MLMLQLYVVAIAMLSSRRLEENTLENTLESSLDRPTKALIPNNATIVIMDVCMMPLSLLVGSLPKRHRSSEAEIGTCAV